jgi:cell shape-determining protein MreC
MKKFSSIMRVNSHHISRDKKIKKILLVGIIALVLLFAVPKVISYISGLVLAPFHAVESWILYSSDSFPYYLRERSAVVAELNDLKYTQSARSGDRLSSQMLLSENETLRSLLSDDGKKRIVSGVIGRPNALPYDVLILDKGSTDGIEEGAPVYIGDDAVIGIVTKVFARTSVVTLITTPGFEASVYILGPNIYTTAEGIGGGQLRVGVPQGIKLEEGNLVIVLGVDSGIYGSIRVVQSLPSEPEQYGFVSPEVPLAGLRLVAVGEAPASPLSFEEAQALIKDVKNKLFAVPIPDHMLVTTDTGSSTATSTATSTQATTTTP